MQYKEPTTRKLSKTELRELGRELRGYVPWEMTVLNEPCNNTVPTQRKGGSLRLRAWGK